MMILIPIERYLCEAGDGGRDMAARDNLNQQQHGWLLSAIGRASERWEVPLEAFSLSSVSGTEATLVNPGKFWGEHVDRVEHTFDLSSPDAPQVQITHFHRSNPSRPYMSTNPSAREEKVGLYDRRVGGQWQVDKLPWNPSFGEEQ